MQASYCSLLHQTKEETVQQLLPSYPHTCGHLWAPPRTAVVCCLGWSLPQIFLRFFSCGQIIGQVSTRSRTPSHQPNLKAEADVEYVLFSQAKPQRTTTTRRQGDLDTAERLINEKIAGGGGGAPGDECHEHSGDFTWAHDVRILRPLHFEGACSW